MTGKQEHRIFVGGLGWDVTERELEEAFQCYGKILECQIVMERDTGRSRGFGFIAFADCQGMEDAIKHMGALEIGDRTLSVEKAHARMGGDDADRHLKEDRAGQNDCFRCGHPGHRARDCRFSDDDSDAGDRVGHDDCFRCGRPGHWARECTFTRGDDVAGDGVGHNDCFRCGRPGHWARECPLPRDNDGAGDRVGRGDCFNCGRPGHWARECPFSGDDGGRGRGSGSSSSPPRFGGAGGHGDRLGERERYLDDRHGGGRYEDRDCLDNRDYKYSGRDRYAGDRHTTSGDRIASDQHGSGSNFLQLAESPRFQEKESPFQAQVPPRQSTPSPAQPSSPPKISEEELSKYFSEADFPSTVSLSTQEDLDMVAAVLQKEIPTKTEDVDTLRTMLFRLGSANGVPSSQQEIFNKIALQLSDISRDYLGFQDQYAHAARSLNKIETLQSSKSVLKKAYSELEEERKATLQIQKEMEERMIFLKAEQKRIKKEIMELTPEASQLAEKLKSANSQRVKLYTDSTGIDSELKPLLDQKLGLQMDFQNSQTGLKLKRQTWEHFRVSLEEARVPPSIYTFSRTVSSSCSQARGSSYD